MLRPLRRAQVHRVQAQREPAREERWPSLRGPDHIFGDGGVKKTAEEFDKEFLGEIPINPEVGKQGDLGKPIVESKPDNEISNIYINLAKKIKLLYLLY